MGRYVKYHKLKMLIHISKIKILKNRRRLSTDNVLLLTGLKSTKAKNKNPKWGRGCPRFLKRKTVVLTIRKGSPLVRGLQIEFPPSYT